MNCHLRLYILGLSMLTLLGALWLWNGRTANAATCDFATCEWAGWELLLDFPNDHLRAQWIVRAGVYDKGRIGRAVHHKEIYDISAQCTPAKPLPIVNGAAIFDGTNFLSCETPNFLQAVIDLLGGEPRFRLNGDFQPWIAGELTLHGALDTSPNRLVTIADHPLRQAPVGYDIAFDLPCTNGCRSLAMQMTLCHPSEGCTVTGKPLPEPVTPGSAYPFWFGAGIGDFIVFHQNDRGRLGEIAAELAYLVGDHFYTPYYSWNFKQSGEIQDYLGYYEIDAPYGLILIGGDPVQKKFFRGEVRLLTVDPASFARGAGCC